MSPAPLALALALTVSQPASPLAEHIWAHCATQPTYALRQACLLEVVLCLAEPGVPL